MVARIADVMPGIVQIGGGFEQPPEVRREPVGVLEAEEKIVGEPRHLARMPQGDAEVFGHLLHHAALIDGQAG